MHSDVTPTASMDYEVETAAENFARRFNASFDMICPLTGAHYYHKRTKAKVLRYPKYTGRSASPEDHARVRLMMFTSWRFINEADLKGSFETYQEALQACKEEVDAHAATYEKMAQEVQDRIEAGFNFEPNIVNVAAAMHERSLDQLEQDQEEAFAIGLEDICNEDVLIKYHINRDVEDSHLPKEQMQAMHQSHCMSVHELHALIRQLNPKQRAYYNHAMHCIMSDMPFIEFLTGGGGTGKSHLTCAILQSAVRWYTARGRAEARLSPDDILVIKLAPTGAAAFQIQGVTIHSGLKVPVKNKNARTFRVPGLTDSDMNTMHTTFRNAKVLLIDEISMVGAGMLHVIDTRMRQIMGNERPFGGLTVIFSGDLFQCAPIMDRWCFLTPWDQVLGGVAAVPLWRRVNVHMFELTQIMRTSDTEWAERINRMRENNMTDADKVHWDALQREAPTLDLSILTNWDRTMTRAHPSYEAHRQRLLRFPRWIVDKKVRRDDHNQKLLDMLPGPAVIVKSKDKVVGAGTQAAAEHVLHNVRTWKRDDTACLHRTLTLKTGMIMRMTINQNTSDGLCNSADGVVRGLTTITGITVTDTSTDSAASDAPLEIVWMEFFNSKVGDLFRPIAKEVYRVHKMPDTVVPLWPVRKSFRYLDGNTEVHRVMFGLTYALAGTVHESQGASRHTVVVDMPDMKMHGMHYVAHSRCTNPSTGMILMNPVPRTIKVDINVQWEMHRMRGEAAVELTVMPLAEATHSTDTCIMTHNISTLRGHKEDVAADPDLKHVSVLCWQETRMPPSEPIEPYLPEGFHIVCAVPAVITGHTLKHGSLIAAREGWTSTHVYECLQTDHLEVLHAQLAAPPTTACKALHLISVYRPPSGSVRSFLNGLHACLRRCSSDHTVVVAGDFNADMTNAQDPIVVAMQGAGFSCPTRHADTTEQGSCLDAIWVRSPLLKASPPSPPAASPETTLHARGLVTYSYFSDHMPVYVLLSAHAQRPQQAKPLLPEPKQGKQPIPGLGVVNDALQPIDAEDLDGLTEEQALRLDWHVLVRSLYHWLYRHDASKETRRTNEQRNDALSKLLLAHAHKHIQPSTIGKYFASNRAFLCHYQEKDGMYATEAHKVLQHLGVDVSNTPNVNAPASKRKPANKRAAAPMSAAPPPAKQPTAPPMQAQPHRVQPRTWESVASFPAQVLTQSMVQQWHEHCCVHKDLQGTNIWGEEAQHIRNMYQPRNSMWRLRPATFICDYTIDAHSFLLNTEHAQKATAAQRPITAIIGTSAIGDWLNAGIPAELTLAPQSTRIRRALQGHLRNGSLGITPHTAWASIQHLLLPLNSPRTLHWLLLHVDRTRRTIFAYDSSREAGAYTTVAVRNLRTALLENSEICDAWGVTDWVMCTDPLGVPVQEQCDCAVFTAFFARHVMAHGSLHGFPLAAEHMHAARVLLFHELEQQRMLYHM